MFYGYLYMYTNYGYHPIFLTKIIWSNIKILKWEGSAPTHPLCVLQKPPTLTDVHVDCTPDMTPTILHHFKNSPS